MKVIKTIGKVIVVLLPAILVWLYIIECPMNYMDGEYSYFRQARDFVSEAGYYEEADILVLGDSRIKSAIIPSELDPSSINLAEGGTTAVEAYYTLCKYIQNKGIPDRVFVSLCAYHFCNFDGFWNRSIYFDFLTYNEARQAVAIANDFGESDFMEEAGGRGLAAILEYKLKSPTKYITPVINSIGENRKQINEDNYNEMVESKGWKPFVSWWKTSFEYDMEEFRMLSTLDYYYRCILDLCNTYDIEVYSLNMPLISTSYEECRDVWEPFSDYFEALKKDYASYDNVHIETEFPEYEKKYFDDADHLNRLGAEKYTGYVKETYLK